MTQTVNSRAFKAADLDGNPYPQHTIPTSVRPWNFVPDESGRPWSGNLVRASDDASLLASADERLWPKQIFDFEFLEATQWKREQIVAIDGTPKAQFFVKVDQIEGCEAEWRDAMKPDVVIYRADATKPSDDRPWPPPTSTSEEGALPVSFGPRVEVTQEMVAAAIGACNEAPSIHWNDVAPAIYRAMHAAAPVELAPAPNMLERDAAIQARDAALVREDHWYAAQVRIERERDAAEARLPWKGATIRFIECDIGHGRLTAANWLPTDCAQCRIAYLEAVVDNMPNAESVKAMLADKDARIAELKSILACTPVAFEDPDAKPAPVPGFLRAIRRGNKATVGLVTGRGDMPTPIDD